MILLDWEGTSSTSPGVILLFGSGLIGSAILDALRRDVHGIRIERKKWTWPKPADSEVATVEKMVCELLALRKDTHLSVIWAAGRSGFGTTADGMAEEFVSLEHVCKTARRIGENLPPGSKTFVHFSSAGGLFEGQVACGRDAVPEPLRPYGVGKLTQERAILSEDDLGSRIILRPSSVYGYGRGARLGLVSSLVAAGIHRRKARIFAALPTLRDFLFAPDIGRFVSSELVKSMSRSLDTVPARTIFLASGRPASVSEILRIVQDRFGTSLYLTVDPRPENARHNTFLPSALPPSFRPTPLEEGIALTAIAMTQERYSGEML